MLLPILFFIGFTGYALDLGFHAGQARPDAKDFFNSAPKTAAK